MLKSWYQLVIFTCVGAHVAGFFALSERMAHVEQGYTSARALKHGLLNIELELRAANK